MFFYYLIFTILTILSFYELFCIKNNFIPLNSKVDIIKHKKIVYIWCFVLSIGAVILSGIRWETGTDWDNYLYMFNEMEQIGFVKYFSIYKGFYGIGFMIMNGIITAITDSYSVNLTIIALIIVLLTYPTIVKYSKYPLTSIWFLFSIVFGYIISVPRNGIALAVIMFSIRYLYEKKFLKFCLCILLATSFHNTAIFFSLAYFIFNFKTNIKKILFISLLSLVSGLFIRDFLSFIVELNILPESIQYRLPLYFLTQEAPMLSLGMDVIVRIFTRGFIVFLIFIYLYRERKSSNLLNGIINLYLFSMMIYIIVMRLGPTFHRIAYYYEDTSQYYIIASCFWYIRNRKDQKLLLFVMVFFYLLAKFSARLILGYSGEFVPFKTIF